MRTAIKWSLAAAVAVTGAGAFGLLAGQTFGEAKLKRQIQVQAEGVPIVTDPARIAHGRYLYATRGCAECHGANGSGREVLNEGGMHVVAPNITAGAHSVTRLYGNADWVRVIRHGVKPDGTPALVMPSENYVTLSEIELSDLISYIYQLPAAEGQTPVMVLPAIVKTLYAFGLVQDAAEKIDHSSKPPPYVPPGITLAHGARVANSCVGCHGPGMSGGRIPGAPPSWPRAANLTPGPGSVLTRYPDVPSFTAMLRSGKRADGSPVSRVMPLASLAQFNDTDVAAMHLYLRSLPPREAGQH